jgi:hypothetical protein
MITDKTKEIFLRIWRSFGKEKRKASSGLHSSLELATNNRIYGNPRLKMAQNKTYCSHTTLGLHGKGLKVQDSMDKSPSHKFPLNENCNLNPDFKNRDRIGATLIHPFEAKDTPFFDLAKILEDDTPSELGEGKSITIQEIYGAGMVFKEFEKNREFRKAIC